MTKFFNLNKLRFEELIFANVTILSEVFSLAGAQVFGNNLRLKIIHLANSNISEMHMSQLIKECQTNTSLIELCLDRIESVPRVLEKFAESLANHESLKVLRLNNCNLKDYRPFIPLLS